MTTEPIGLAFDASCDLPNTHWRSHDGVHLLPLEVSSGGQSMWDAREERATKRFFRKPLRERYELGTSALSEFDTTQWMTQAMALRHDRVLGLFSSIGRPDAIDTASRAAQAVREDTASQRIGVGRAKPFELMCVESGNAMAGYALQAIDLIEHRDMGHSWDALRTRLAVMHRKTRSFLVTGDWSYLKTVQLGLSGGAQASAWAGFLARITGRTPALGLHRNHHEILGWNSGAAQARAWVYEQAMSQIERGSLVSRHICISTNMQIEEVRSELGHLALRAAAARAGIEVHIAPMSVSGSVQVGEGAFSLGLACEDSPW